MNALVEQMLYKIMNTQLREWPYPHFYATDVFPYETYQQLQVWLDDADTGETFRPLDGGYAHRTFTDELPPFLSELEGGRFARGMMQYFTYQFHQRYPNAGRPTFEQDWRFIRDEEGYSIGPHTDAPRKVMSLLFYLPKTPEHYRLGTRVYVPDDGKKTCAGGPHYPFEGFTDIFTAPMMPNSCFGFWKTKNSWHGVPEISQKVRRDVLLFNIYEQKQDASPKIVVP